MSGDHTEPRKPKNLQGLLHFCTAATASEDAPAKSTSQPMDPERLKFLKEVMEGMTVRLDKQMAAQVSLLVHSPARHDSSVTDTEQEEMALEALLELVQDIDNANDLVKMGAVKELLVMTSEFQQSGEVLALVCEVLAAVAQNNPLSQEHLLSLPAMSSLMALDDSQYTSVRVKAFYAVSCLLRGHPDALAAFTAEGGLPWLLRSMKAGNDKLMTKTVFLVDYLVGEYEDVRESLVSLGYCDLLIQYLCHGTTTTDQQTEEPTHQEDASDQYSPCREHCTSALARLHENSQAARDTCKKHHKTIITCLEKRKTVIQGREEHQDELQHIVHLLSLLSAPTMSTPRRQCTSMMAVGAPAC